MTTATVATSTTMNNSQMGIVNGNGNLNNGKTNSEINSLYNNNASRTRGNPFKLIPCEKYSSDDQAPFTVRLSIEALLIIDIHAHCMTTEVIGLLGGKFCKQTNQLFILTAEPCHTIDDHNLQCEMEPVSQAIASERLALKGYHVVGWYHSHPTFVPNPSLRDLETQSKYQRMFSLENDKPFIALILSPYSTLNQPALKNSLVSKYKVLTLFGDEESIDHSSVNHSSFNNDHHSCETQNSFSHSSELKLAPYELKTHLIRREKMMFMVTSKMKQLLSNIIDKSTAIPMMDKIKRFKNGDITYLQKLLASLKFHLEQTGLSQVEIDFLLSQCKAIVEDNQSIRIKSKSKDKKT